MRQISRTLGFLVAAAVTARGSGSASPTAAVSGPFVATFPGTISSTSGAGGTGGPVAEPNLIIFFTGTSGSVSSGYALG
jgi:hypothetical protein